ncbi:DNA polymerase III subunit delta' [Limoniibacter endophyticus]|uniref:DNA polymerase III subunit delta n=1 Tax=Limoniibacter endophyticus TaxID=1565040 RepID=A0A8J3DEK5_9HYPH|nr:DNA polymerase III subunit delta' [Limoniibacter endophyticus]GHC61033.1 DNA polymerase III subunit delta' [Limoniibacter endophyticus]
MNERLAPENYDTLDNVLEPAENPYLVGHDAIQIMLAQAYREGKLHHGLMFAGARGIGKATLAFHLAYHLMRHPDHRQAPERLQPPDPSSGLFRQIATGAHPAILHLSRPFNDKTKTFKSVITVEEIRRVSKFLSMTASDGSPRVVIVDPAEDMNINAANALLKNLEEPPARTHFILITHAPGRLLPTIRSRCQLQLFHPLEDEAMTQVVSRFGMLGSVERNLPEALASRADGSPRNAVLLTQYGGMDIAEAVEKLVASSTPDIGTMMRLADAVTGRDSVVQFELFNREMLDVVAGRASIEARTGNIAYADRLSHLWQEVRQTTIECETYNLDKRQHVFSLIEMVRVAFAG